MELTETQLNELFGLGSGGVLERARRSDRLFVRSQDEIARYTKGATGLVMTAVQAARLPADKLAEILEFGSAVLPVNSEEPAQTLRAQRSDLGLTIADLHKVTGLSTAVLADAESSDKASDIHILTRIARVLALDEFRLSVEPSAGADRALAIRLRAEDKSLKAQGVLALTEAAWVIRQQVALSPQNEVLAQFVPSDIYGDYSYPAWQHGRYLAQETRRKLNLGNGPIPSLHRLIESLQIPVVQQKMPSKIAGATVNVSGARGIVANLEGDNQKATVRRFTLAHELGHLLWDPDQRLDSLRVDDFSEMEVRISAANQNKDPVESRANAFAIEFLAPVSAVEKIFSTSTPEDTLRKIMVEFGVSYTAALHHLHNCTDFKGHLSRPQEVDNNDWRAVEDPDYFPIKTTPDSRRGQFARRLVEAESRHEIHAQVAASWLGCTESEYERTRASILRFS